MASLSRNTIKKWLRAPQGEQPKYRRPEVPTKLTPFVEVLTQTMTTDGHWPRHERRTARALHAELQPRADRLHPPLAHESRQAQQHQRLRAVGLRVRQCLPVRRERGKLVVGGIYYRLQAAQMKLCASRAFWLAAWFQPRTYWVTVGPYGQSVVA